MQLLLSILLLFALIYCYDNRLSQSLIKTLLYFSVFVFASTECLSAFNSINPTSFSILYSLFCATTAMLLYQKKRTGLIQQFKKNIGALLANKSIVALAVIIITPLFLTAICIAPNNWDSMTYHLPRVEHWIQNKNVNYYPSENIRQVFHQPLAEYFILHIKTLTSSDKYVNLIQLIFYLGCLATVWKITKLLSNGLSTAVLSVTIVACTPIILLEATTTQNDIVGAFFFLTGIYFLLLLKSNFSYAIVFNLIIALILGFLTKASVLIFLFPFFIVFAFPVIKVHKTKLILPVLAGAFIIGLFSLPYFSRNIAVSGRLMGDESVEKQMKNNPLSLKSTLVNVCRNMAMNMALPSEKYNHMVDAITQKLQLITTGEVDAPGNTFGAKYRTEFRINEDLAGQFVLFFSFFIAMLFFFFKRSNYPSTVILLLIATLLSFVLFSAIFKWQPWGVRLFIPLYALMGIFFPIAIGPFIKFKTLFLLSFLFIITGIPYLLANENKPFLPVEKAATTFGSREKHYFIFTEKINYYKLDDFKKITDYLNGNDIKNVGLNLANDTWEYPLWVLKKGNTKYYYVHFPEYLKRTPNYHKEITIEAIITNKNNYLDKKVCAITDSVVSNHFKLYTFEKTQTIEQLSTP